MPMITDSFAVLCTVKKTELDLMDDFERQLPEPVTVPVSPALVLVDELLPPPQPERMLKAKMASKRQNQCLICLGLFMRTS